MRLAILTLLVGCTAGGEELTGPDAAADQEGPNLLTNSDFEQVQNNWVSTWENHDSNPNGDIVVVSDAHSGSHALQWQMDAEAGDGREYWVTQHGLTTIKPGHRYALAGWYKVDAGGEVWLNYIVRGEPNGEPDLSSLGPGGIIPTVVGEWAPFRFEINTPLEGAPASYEVSLHSIKFNYKATKLTIDDVRLVEIKTSDRWHVQTDPRD